MMERGEASLARVGRVTPTEIAQRVDSLWDITDYLGTLLYAVRVSRLSDRPILYVNLGIRLLQTSNNDKASGLFLDLAREDSFAN